MQLLMDFWRSREQERERERCVSLCEIPLIQTSIFKTNENVRMPCTGYLRASCLNEFSARGRREKEKWDGWSLSADAVSPHVHLSVSSYANIVYYINELRVWSVSLFNGPLMFLTCLCVVSRVCPYGRRKIKSIANRSWWMETDPWRSGAERCVEMNSYWWDTNKFWYHYYFKIVFVNK